MVQVKTWCRKIGRGLAVGALCAVAAGCATNPPGTVYDPFEPVNRQVFAFNSAVDTVLVRPVAVVYRDWAPRPFKMMLGNLVNHLTLPMTIVNDLLQGKPEQAKIAASRFFVNTVAGMGGLIDVATPTGLKLHQEDMGQTFAVHGSGPGPYLVLPLLGPSNMRDGIGTLIDWYADPIHVASYFPNEGGTAFRYGHAGAIGLVRREELIDPIDSLKRSSLDYYATVRAAYNQQREAAIRDGKPDPAAAGRDAFSETEKATNTQ
ncbi:MAG: VacJ family lipoprotein [Alphaproteobacteria bacterium]|nr:VacJ family lipoprotein [Alphaproteobacteria bacterium]MCB9928567.1 VacJ family lipoprotein [Alphaproteobacteria bacterium]